MTKKLYDNILPPAHMRDMTMDQRFYVPNTRDGHKVAQLLHDNLAADERELLFKTAAEDDEEDLSEAYRKVKKKLEDEKAKKKKKKKDKDKDKEDEEGEDEDKEDEEGEDEDKEDEEDEDEDKEDEEDTSHFMSTDDG